MELVEDALAHDDLGRARTVAARMTGTDSLIAMRIDHRFDALVAADPKLFDVRAAAEREVKRLRAAVAKNPKALGALTQLLYAQYATGEFDAVLARSNDAISRAARGTEKNPAYDDLADQLNWIYNQKSLALRALGRWDDSLAAMRSGSAAGEKGSANVSQTINLGYFLVEMGRPKDALAETDRVDWNRGVSPYGRMQLQYVRCAAYLQLGQKDEVDKVLAWFREHEIDSKQTAQAAYMESGDQAGAAALLIARLRDPDDRALAMLEVQDYRELPQSEQDRKTRILRDQLLARPDVVAAIDAVGRREKQPVYTLEF
jgi:tetratricopeptide (TPR) repeat protein